MLPLMKIYRMRIDPQSVLTPAMITQYGFTEGVDQDDAHQQVPKILHRMWKNDDLNSMPKPWRKAFKTCARVHKDWKVKLWTDSLLEDFIRSQYPWFFDTYASYEHNIQRVDAARYFILYHYGGVYLDLDIDCKRSMEPIRKAMYATGKSVLIPVTTPIGFSNDLMFGVRGAPFFNILIRSLSEYKRSYGSPYLTVMYSTGPIFLSSVFDNLLQSAKEEIGVLPPELYSSNGQVPFKFFRHMKGRSWHGMVRYQYTSR